MSKSRTRATPAPIEEQPQSGGTYIRLPDGSLVRDVPEASPGEPEHDQIADPAADSAEPNEQEA